MITPGFKCKSSRRLLQTVGVGNNFVFLTSMRNKIVFLGSVNSCAVLLYTKLIIIFLFCSLALGGGKKRDPGNEVGVVLKSDHVHDILRDILASQVSPRQLAIRHQKRDS